VTDRSNVAARLTLVLCTALFFLPVLTGSALLFERDTLTNTHPLRWMATTQLAHGEWPLWNPAVFLGQPLMAGNVAQVLYPPGLLFLVLPFEMAFQLFFILHTLLMGLATHALLRQWRLSQAASLWGALALAFNSVVLQFTNNSGWLPAAWTPLFLLLLQRAPGSARWAVGAAAVLAVQIFGGELQLVSWSVALGALLLWHHASRETRWSAAAALFSVVGLAVLLSMVLLLPSMELGALSDRSAGVPLEVAGRWSFHPARLVELLVPLFFGGNPLVQPDAAWGNTFHNSADLTAWWVSATVAMVTMPAIAALRGERWREARWLLGVGLLGTVLALGIHTPLFAAIHRFIPLVGLFRYPEKYLFLMVFGMVLAGAFGLDGLVDDGVARRRFVYALIAMLVMLAAVLLLSVTLEAQLTPEIQATVQREFAQLFNPDTAWAVLRGSAAQRAVLCLCVLGMVALWQRGRVPPRVVHGTLLLVTLVDTFSVHQAVVPLAPPAATHSPCGGAPVVQALRARAGAEPFRVHWNASVPTGVDTSASAAAAWAAWTANSCRPNLGAEQGLEYATGYSGIRLKTLEDLNRRGLLKRLLPAMNVRFYAVDLAQPPLPSRSEVLLFEPGQVRWDEDPQALPRAFLASSVHWVRTDEETFQALASPDFDPRYQAVLRGEGAAPAGPAAGVVRVRYEGSQRVILNVETATGGYVILSDAYYPGWTAERAGVPVPILQANHIMRAVAVEPGHHTIVIQYRPRSVQVGLAVSVVGCVLALLALARRPKAR